MKIERYRGDTFPIAIQVKSRVTDEAQDVTGWTFLLTVNSQRAPSSSASQVFQIEGVITDAANGSVEFSPDETQAANTGVMYFDIQATINGKIRTLTKDEYIVEQDITK
jgi:hypothetical protein